MNDLLAVSICHASGKLQHHFGTPFSGLGFALQLGIERATIYKFEGEKRCAIEFTDLINLNDVGVGHRTNSAGFKFESSHILGVDVSTPENHFKGDHTPQSPLFCAINNAHSSSPQLSQNVVTWHIRKLASTGVRLDGTYINSSITRPTFLPRCHGCIIRIAPTTL